MSTMISRYHGSSRKEQPYAEQPSSSSHPQDAPHNAQHRSFQSSSAFQFDFPLANEELAAIKAADSLAPRRSDAFDFGLSAFSDPNRDSNNNNIYPGHHPYEPTRLQILPQSHASEYPPPTYIPSTASNIPSGTFAFPSSSASRSLSPRDHTGWPEPSSPLSLGPHDGATNSPTDLAFDTQLSHIAFPVDLHPSQPSLQNLPPSRPRENTRLRVANGLDSPSSHSSQRNSEPPCVKLGPNGLAADQPPTAQGKMRTRVYVACLQCRSRKIRCDGAKPKCQKCSRRSSECDYDPAPKRRGPDKKPGARQRTSKKAKESLPEEAQQEQDPPVGSAHGPNQPEANAPGGVHRKRRRASGTDPSPACSGDAEDLDSIRGSSSSSTEGQAPATPRDHPAVTLELAAITDLSDVSRESVHQEKAEPNTVKRLDTILHQPAFHGRLAYNFNGSGTTHVGDGGSHNVSQPLGQPRHTTLPPHSATTINYRYFPSTAHIESVDEQEGEEEGQHLLRKRKWSVPEIGSEPSLDFSRKTWWDSLLATYIPGSDRATATRQIHTDLQFLFKSSNYFFSFFNVPLFFSVFCNPLERDNMQPSLVLAGLAVSTFLNSGELNGGNAGRLRAVWLRDVAQSALEASFNAQWIEPTLAQAAWLLALFEMCAHPYHSPERVSSALVMLDSIIRSLALTSIDADEPSVSVFTPRAVPSVPVASHARVRRQEGCSCHSLTLGQISRSSHEHTPLWVATAAWNPDWTLAEIRKEESRRLCWSALSLAAGHTSHAAAFSSPALDYFCIQPANYALLFPGEALLQSSAFNATHSAKESVWALYSRAMLLWNSCLRMRGDDVSDHDKAAFALNAWIESTTIEEALDAHTCGCDQAFMFQGREFLFITRMCISYEFRRYIPHPDSYAFHQFMKGISVDAPAHREVNGLFHRKKAEEWLIHQATVAKRIMHGLHTVTGHKQNVLAQRPFFVWWFMGQVARALTLWQCDNSLTYALEVCQAFFPPIDYLSCLWPCPVQRARYMGLYRRVADACRTARLAAPLAPNFDLLAPGSPPVTVV